MIYPETLCDNSKILNLIAVKTPNNTANEELQMGDKNPIKPPKKKQKKKKKALEDPVKKKRKKRKKKAA